MIRRGDLNAPHLFLGLCFLLDPLQLPLDDHFRQVHRQLPVLHRRGGRKAEALDGRAHVLHQVVADGVVNTVVPHDQLQDVEELLHAVALLYDYLLGPVSQHRVAVFHPHRHGGRQDLQRLSHHAPRFDRMRFQQAVEN